MAFLIDTSIFIGLERRTLGVASLEAVVPYPDDRVALASITASELLAGVHRADSESRRQRRHIFVEAILESMPILTFDLRTARTHAQIWTKLMQSGQTIGAHDLLIAATALSHGYEVLSENLRDFQRVPDLIMRQPRW